MSLAPRGRKPPPMVIPKHRTLEFRVLDVLWREGAASIMPNEGAPPPGRRPSYETVRSVIYRLQARKAIRRTKQVGKMQIFEAAIAREEVQQQLIDDFASLFAPDIRPVIDRLVATGRLTLEDLRQAERLLDEARKIG
jgi:BlaI family penicillinase repressor